MFGETMGKSKVYRNGNEVFVEGFNYSVGISGFNKVDYSVDIRALDEYLFYLCQHTNYSHIYVTIIPSKVDDYGNTVLEKKITIGKIDTHESKKYKNISYWRDDYGFFKMFNKDRAEYERTLQEESTFVHMGSGGFSIIPKYMPKSIL